MQLLIALLSLLLLIPAALAGIAAGLRDLANNSEVLVSQVEQLFALGQSLWPACCALALVSAGVIVLFASVWLAIRGLQLRA
jgi:hypothetical protein